MSIDDYCKTFNVKYEELQTQSFREHRSNDSKRSTKSGRCGFQKGGPNPAKSEQTKSGRNSAWSMNFKGYDGLSDEEKIKRIQELTNRANTTREKNHSYNSTIEFYLSRGYSKKEAKSLLSERQRTFSLAKCIEKYGKEEGYRRWKARQEKWQNTLKSKSPEEIRRINDLKFKGILKNNRYSRISQELFNELYDKIKSKYKKIYFAT